MLTYSIRLRCPDCGKTRLFERFFKMNRNCAHCNLSFEREQGFYLGAIYFNYGFTALVVAIVYPVLVFAQRVSPNAGLLVCMSFAVMLPVLFFRHSRSLWLAFDQFIDPQPVDRSDESAS